MSDKQESQEPTAPSGAMIIKSAAELNPAEYNRLVECATLEEIRLVESAFFIAPNYFDEEFSAERRFRTNQKADAPVYDEESSSLVCGFEFSVEVMKDEQKLLTCSAHYIVFFAFAERVDNETAKFFANRTGRNAAYPYFRQFAASQSWASGANLPILPILKSKPAKKSESKKSAKKKTKKKKV